MGEVGSLALPDAQLDGMWFRDERTPLRRMRVSWHTDRRIVVVSLWQGDGCTGTFRLPIADAPALIALLAGSLGDAATPSTPTPTKPAARPSLLDRVRSVLRRGRRRAHDQRSVAPVVPIRRAR